MAEIDKLEISIESSAAGAEKELSKLQKILKQLSSTLSGVKISDSMGLDSDKNDKFTESVKKLHKALGVTEDSTEKLQKAFADMGKGFKFSGNSTQLKNEIEKVEKQLDRLWAKEDKMKFVGTSTDTQGWKSLQYDILRTSNYLQELRAQFGKLSSENLQRFQSLPIDRGVSSDIGDNTRRNATVSPDSLKYDQGAMEAIFGETFGDIQNWQQAVSRFGASASSAFNGVDEAVEKLTGTIRKSRLSSEEFEAALEDLEIPEISETSLKKLQSALDRTEAKIKKLTAQQANDIRLGVDVDSDGIRRLSRQIVEASKYADALREKINQIGESAPRMSVFDKLKSSSAGILRAFESLGRKIQKVFAGSTNLIKKSVSGISGVLKKAASSLLGFGKSGKGLSGMLRTIGLSARFMFASFVIRGSLDSAKEGMQNLAQYSQITNRSISTLMSSLTQLKNALATAFAPVLNTITPALDFLIQKVVAAVNAVGQLTSALTGQKSFVQAKKVFQDYAASLGDNASAADKAQEANEKLRKTLLGFDEVNKLDDNSSVNSGTSSSGGGVSPMDMFEVKGLDSAISDFAQKIRDAWGMADFTEIGNIVGTKLNNALRRINWDEIKSTATRISRSISTFLNGGIASADWYLVGNTLAQALNTAIGFGYTFVNTFDWSNFGIALSSGVNGLVQNVEWETAASTFSSGIKGILDSISTFIENTEWQNLGKKIASFFAAIDWPGISRSTFRAIGSALGGLSAFIVGLFGDAVAGAKQFIIGHFTESGKWTWEGFKKGVLDVFSGIGAWINNNIFQPFIKGFQNAFGIHSPSTVMAAQGNYIIEGLYRGILDKKDKLLNWFKELPGKITSSIGNLWGVGKDVIKSFVDGFSSIRIPMPHINWNWNKVNFGSSSFSIPSFNLKWYASGGFPNTGELFMANENGPEMIGKMGSRNVVANNKQITEGIKNAVVEGMTQVMMMNSTNQGKNATVVDTHLYLDGREIARSVKKALDNEAFRRGQASAFSF